jgi:hypothetical protein
MDSAACDLRTTRTELMRHAIFLALDHFHESANLPVSKKYGIELAAKCGLHGDSAALTIGLLKFAPGRREKQ